MIWKLAEAKNKFSEVVRRALDEGPQRVSRRGREVVVVDAEEFERLTGARRSFKDLLLDAPDLTDLDLSRDPTPPRDPELP